VDKTDFWKGNRNIMKINKLAIAGADDKVDQSELVALSAEFPFIEWSILLSKNKEGSQRYPSPEWVAELAKKDLPLSAHFCGWLARQVLEEKNYELIKELPETFKRVQLNYNFRHSGGFHLQPLVEFMASYPSKSIIFQLNKSNTPVLKQLVQDEKLTPNIHFLYDASGGYGKVIERIEGTIDNQYTGYAGGLNPENIEAICQMITNDPEQVETYVDLESGVRTDNEFDLSKVRDIAEKVAKFI
jgi:phosphoribosylanthranilate isomerase